MTGNNRSISTVVDVTIALVLISVSVTTLFLYLDQDQRETVPVQADRTAETLSGTTVEIEYSVQNVTSHDRGIFNDTPSHAFNRSAHGKITRLLARAAVTNTEFWGSEFTRMGVDFEDSIDASTRSEITGVNHDVRVDALWRAYDGSGISGEAAAGPNVPKGVDVNSVTLTVPSGMPNASKDIANAYAGDGNFEQPARIIAETIMEGFLPPAEMQRALESSSFERQFALYKYYRMSTVMDTLHDSDWPDERQYDPNWIEVEYPFDPKLEENSVLRRQNVNTLWLNQYMVEQTLANKIEDNLDARFNDSISGEELASKVSIDKAYVTIRTWNTNE